MDAISLIKSKFFIACTAYPLRFALNVYLNYTDNYPTVAYHSPHVFFRMDSVSQALEELLVAAQRQDCLTVGVYESAKLMNV